MKQLISASLITASLLVVLLCTPSIASANGTDPVVLWTLTNVTFEGGGMAVGSFMFNGTTFGDISITTPLKPTAPGYTGIWASGGVPTATGVDFGSTNPLDLIGPVLSLRFSGLGVGTTPGVVPLVPGTPELASGGSGEFSCSDAGCVGSTTPVLITGGEVVGTAITTPEPSALSLLSMGLFALLAFASIRKVSHA